MSFSENLVDLESGLSGNYKCLKIRFIKICNSNLLASLVDFEKYLLIIKKYLLFLFIFERKLEIREANV